MARTNGKANENQIFFDLGGEYLCERLHLVTEYHQQSDIF